MTSTSTSATHHASHRVGTITGIFVTIVRVGGVGVTCSTSSSLGGKCLQLVHVDSFKQQGACQIGIVLSHSEGLDAQISGLVGDGHERAHRFFVNTRWQSIWSDWLSNGLRLGYRWLCGNGWLGVGSCGLLGLSWKGHAWLGNLLHLGILSCSRLDWLSL